MKNLTKLLIILLLVVSTGCSNFPVIEPVEVCALNVNGGYCRCAPFDFNYGLLKSTGESYNKPLKDCHKNIGLSGEDWINLIHYIDSIYVWKDRHKNFKSNTKECIIDKKEVGAFPNTDREVYWHQTPLNLLYE